MWHDVEITPGRGWRILRRFTQALMIFALLISPLLGGWQRLDRAKMATWERGGSELPVGLAELLPVGEAARRAHLSNVLLGGGLAAELADIPAADPVAGSLALFRTGISASPRVWLAVALPILLAAFAGRVFCGWFCPFGTLARYLGSITDRLRWPRLRIPERRPLRWLVLLISLAAGLMGSHILLYASLPHLLLQQTVYSAWLLGGGSIVLGILLGLLLAITVFGPSSYCALLCPTGAVLSGLGRLRSVRLRIANAPDCGLRRAQCDRACWLQLHPASGDPGPDCDLCARCVGACPRSNLRIGLGRGAPKTFFAKWAAVALLLVFSFAAEAEKKPRLLLRGETVRHGVTVAISAVDLAGVQLGADTEEVDSATELTVFVARGARGPADRRGRLPSREVYSGPLEIRVTSEDKVRSVLSMEPNSPRSTPRRTLYRSRVALELAAGDILEIAPIAGWIDKPVAWRVPELDRSRSGWHIAQVTVASALAFSGLLALAFAFHSKTVPEPMKDARRTLEPAFDL